MPITIDKAFGIHADALMLRGRRASLLASNLANADTPNYQARDIDFKDALKAVHSQADPAGSVRLLRTHGGHQTYGHDSIGQMDLMYRVPSQASLDGNTVDADTERGEFTENALGYLVSLRFLTGRVQALRAAIKGE